MASPAAKAALERRLRGASARVTPRDDDDDTINNDAQATPRPPPFSPDEVPTQGKERPRGRRDAARRGPAGREPAPGPKYTNGHLVLHLLPAAAAFVERDGER